LTHVPTYLFDLRAEPVQLIDGNTFNYRSSAIDR
jgi:hypothetical protein